MMIARVVTITLFPRCHHSWSLGSRPGWTITVVIRWVMVGGWWGFGNDRQVSHRLTPITVIIIIQWNNFMIDCRPSPSQVTVVAPRRSQGRGIIFIHRHRKWGRVRLGGWEIIASGCLGREGSGWDRPCRRNVVRRWWVQRRLIMCIPRLSSVCWSPRIARFCLMIGFVNENGSVSSIGMFRIDNGRRKPIPG